MPSELLVFWQMGTILLGMDHLITAVFDSGVFRPLQPVDLAEGTQVQIQVPTTSVSDSSDTDKATTTPWGEFIEQTYGSCAELGLERHDQGDFELRESIK
jgi:predicted DNA-binding antitoxin AbrB/MazE fold protein